MTGYYLRVTPRLVSGIYLFDPTEPNSVCHKEPKDPANPESNAVKEVDACGPLQASKSPPQPTASNLKSMDLKSGVQDTDSPLSKAPQVSL